jgi:tetratricopeptide (TPR) repeat protein
VPVLSRLPYVIAAGVVAFVVVLLALVQFASDAVYAPIVAPRSLVARIPQSFGVRTYEAIDDVAPAAYVNDALASNALLHGDPTAAERYALRMPAEARRDDLLARAAQAQGNDVLAREYYFAADDVEATQAEIARVARTDVPEALALEAQFRDRLMSLRTHPDAVAGTYLVSGNLEASLHDDRGALVLYEDAAALAPHNMAYVLSAANAAFRSGDMQTARYYFERGLSDDPNSGDCLSGLGLVALHRGDRGQALVYLQRARTVDPHAQMIPALEAALR